MKKFLKHLFVGLALLTVALQSSAKQKLETDYSNIKGVCYLGWRADETTVRTQLGYAKRIGINSTRIWLWGYDNDPKQFISSLKNYVRIANDMGITVMPILWNGNSLNPAIFWKRVTGRRKEMLMSKRPSKPSKIWMACFAGIL